MVQKVYLGLGSNIGDRSKNIGRAIFFLQADSEIIVKRVSSLYETEPYGLVEQASFINCVLELETMYSPPSLLQKLQEIEKLLGRKERIKWGPRVIDLDILLYGDKIISEEGLKIPHPGLTERPFVLVPLVELAADFTHPVFEKTIRELHDQLADRMPVEQWGIVNKIGGHKINYPSPQSSPRRGEETDGWKKRSKSPLPWERGLG